MCRMLALMSYIWGHGEVFGFFNSYVRFGTIGLSCGKLLLGKTVHNDSQSQFVEKCIITISVIIYVR